MEKLVSIIIPVYKVENYINRCLRSVVNQTYTNVEIILVDDGSPDQCGIICDEWAKKDKRICVIHKENGGLSSARNEGLKISTGAYICFVDSDDWISVDMVEYLISLVSKYNADIASASYVLSKNEMVNFEDKNSDIKVMNRNQALQFYLEYGISHRISDYPIWNKIYKRELFENIKFPENTIYEDYTTNIELILSCEKYVKSFKECYCYFQGGSSIIRSPLKKRDLDLIKQSKKALQLVSGIDYLKVKELSVQKMERAYFSLLLKIALFGFDSSVGKKDRAIIVKNLEKNYRRCFGRLLKSDMPFNRKIFMPVLFVNYKLLFPLRVIVSKV